jgi:hypothetical protein
MHPVPVFEWTNNHQTLVACRLQLPLAPATVRVASSMLSKTVKVAQQGVDLHGEANEAESRDFNTLPPRPTRCCATWTVMLYLCSTSVMPHADNHNAAMVVGLTRVMQLADMALTDDTRLHSGILATGSRLQNRASGCWRTVNSVHCTTQRSRAHFAFHLHVLQKTDFAARKHPHPLGSGCGERSS